MAITPTSVTNVVDPTGVAPWSVATITLGTVLNPVTNVTSNVESVLFELRGANASTYGGAVETDYSVGTNGALTVLDQIATQPNGAVIATYFGPEQANPILEASLAGEPPANPSYAYTQYFYANDGTLSQVVAAQPNGRIYVGV